MSPYEWMRIEGDEATIGLTVYGQEQLGEIVHVELPEVGTQFKQGDVAGVVESVKAASDLYMPMDGTITAVNEPLPDEPGQINTDAFAAWLIKFKPSNPAQFEALMDVAAYEAFVASEAH